MVLGVLLASMGQGLNREAVYTGVAVRSHQGALWFIWSKHDTPT